MASKVEMRPAYEWTCPECGRDYFERGIVPEMSEEDLAELREEHGLEPWEVGVFMLMPEHVECSECNCKFETERMSDGE